MDTNVVESSQYEVGNFNLDYGIENMDINEDIIVAMEIEAEFNEQEDVEESASENAQLQDGEESAAVEDTENVEPPECDSLPNSQEMDRMVIDAGSKSTSRATSWGVNKFKKWAQRAKRNVDLSTITPVQLNQELRRFYAGVKGDKGRPLTPSALTGLRSAIHRHLTLPPLSRPINIISDREFTSSNQMFLAKCRLYYKEGNKRPEHKPPIESGDMKKLADYFKNWDSEPTVLLDYVWFCLCFYFGRRGREGWRDLTKNSFKVSKDDRDRPFIYMVHTDLTKNHRGGNKQNEQDYSTQKIYGSQGHLNIIEVFDFYISKLNPKCSALFQTPLPHYTREEHWFKNEPMGKNSLGNIMKRMSRKAGLSQEYTCHSVRASTITILGHAGVEGRNICNITKHKDEKSLKHYVTNMSNDQKQACSTILSKALEPQQDQVVVPAIDYPQPQQNNQQANQPVVSAEQLPDGSFAISLPMVPQQNQPSQLPVQCGKHIPCHSTEVFAKSSAKLQVRLVHHKYNHQ